MKRIGLTSFALALFVAASPAAHSSVIVGETEVHASIHSQPYIRLSRDAGGESAWSDEPYSWTTADGRVLNQGVTDSDGHAIVSRVEGVRNYILDTVNMSWTYRVDDACWNRKAAEFGGCVRPLDSVNKVTQRLDDEERAKQEARTELRERALERYHEAAATNSDELSWLGPLPMQWSDEAYRSRQSALYKSIERDFEEWKPDDLAAFTCKSPQQFGPVPNQHAVIEYLAQGQPGNTQGRTWAALVEAARKGNWMARFQIYAALGHGHGGDLTRIYRRLQLGEWLEANHVGPLYSSFMKALGATGYFGGQSPSGDSLPYVYAALHGSYSAMDSVGRTLSFADDETKQAVGKRMRDCAREMLPVLFGTK